MKKSNIFIALLVIIIVVVWICSQKGYNHSNNNEQYVTPIYKEIVIKKDISGKLYPEMEINAKSSVSGTLEEYFVQIGDMVKGRSNSKGKGNNQRKPIGRSECTS